MKVFGIGFHKTGTSSLGVALSTLGYDVCFENGQARRIFDTDLPQLYEIVDKYSAFKDNPWAVLYKDLDRKYANSKFILTVRDEKSWIKSVVNHFGRTHTRMREKIYGVGRPLGNEEKYLSRYREHNINVVDHFQNRPNDLLVVSWQDGGQWSKLCNFLEKEIPDIVFPHVNKGVYIHDVEKPIVLRHAV